MTLKRFPRKISRSGAYVVKAAEARSQSVPPGTTPLPPSQPTAADKALVAAVWRKLAG